MVKIPMKSMNFQKLKSNFNIKTSKYVQKPIITPLFSAEKPMRAKLNQFHQIDQNSQQLPGENEINTQENERQTSQLDNLPSTTNIQIKSSFINKIQRDERVKQKHLRNVQIYYDQSESNPRIQI